MGLQGDQVTLFLSGQDVPIPECNIIIHQPTLKQIALFKESNFLLAVNLFSDIGRNAEKIRQNHPMIDQFSDFDILMALINQDQGLQDSVQKFFQLVFPRYNIDINDTEIRFLEEDRCVGIVHSRNYISFIETIKNLFLLPTKRTDYDPANEKAAAIAEKFKKRKEILAKMKNKDESTVSLFGSYASILSIGMHIDINTI